MVRGAGGWATFWLSTFLRGDRKSTRLNSSHANISYAVFCLKKKKDNYSNAFVSGDCKMLIHDLAGTGFDRITQFEPDYVVRMSYACNCRVNRDVNTMLHLSL